MQSLLGDIGTQTWLPLHVIAMRLVLSAVLGAVIGFERETHRRPAGLRTHILVCIAAATVAITAVEIAHSPVFDGPQVRIDPIRLIGAVTAGVAFLAAGMIVFARGEVHGLTTGAGLWLAGAIGLASGLGIWQLAVMAAGLALVVLWLLRSLERRLLGRTDKKD